MVLFISLILLFALPSPSSSITVSEGGLSMDFVFVKGGCFEMGDTFGDGYFAEHPVHNVCLDSFYIGRFEVTEGQWMMIMEEKPVHSNGFENRPVVNVNYHDIQEFISRLNRITGKKFRLPTEAEWEYACRSKGKKERYAGFSREEEVFKYANFCDVHCPHGWMNGTQDDGYEGLAPVGSYRANGLGIHDMSGNVWEWVGDWFDVSYYNHGVIYNPRGPAVGIEKVIRGGCHLNSPFYLRCSYRTGLSPEWREKDIGFRLVFTED
ncbi:MAG: formylglycine-generating enzyme family protein [Syntrophorhabdaceae bacterium]|nr:formylglycine-generating enzyme family protein [Syntrophorhabdaceae bacterium]